MSRSIDTLIAELEAAPPNGNGTVRQQVYTTFGPGLVDELVFAARRMGLEAKAESGRGWINKPHLITVSGRVSTLLTWAKMLRAYP